MTCLAYAFHVGDETWRREVAIAAIVLLCGPPWQAGKTASLTRFSRSLAFSTSLRKKMRPARGPRRVLCLVYFVRKRTVAAEMHSRSGSNDVTVLEGAQELSSGNQTRSVSHIAHQEGTLIVSDLPEILVVPIARICRGTANEQARLKNFGSLFDLRIINQVRRHIKAVWQRLEIDGRSRDFLLSRVIAVRQMSSIRETETHETILRLNHGCQCGEASSILVRY
jgi:hypothetical protein